MLFCTSEKTFFKKKLKTFQVVGTGVQLLDNKIVFGAEDNQRYRISIKGQSQTFELNTGKLFFKKIQQF